MQRFRKILFAALVLGLAGAGSAVAHEVKAGALTVDHPWARATAPGAPNGAVYFTLENEGAEADRLLGASGEVAERIELHEHIHEGGVMKMREVAGGIALPAKSEVAFAPGGLHMMLLGLKQPLAAGSTFPLRLRFERAGEVDVQVEVEKADAKSTAHRHH